MLPIQKVPTWRTLCSTATGRVNACLTRDHRSFIQTPQSCKHRPLLLQKERRNQKMISGSTNLSLDPGIPVVLVIKNPPANAGNVRDVGLTKGRGFDAWVRKILWRRKWQPILAWRITWTEEPVGLQLQRVGHNVASTHTFDLPQGCHFCSGHTRSETAHVSVLVSCGCHNKSPQAWWLQTTEIYSLPVLGTRSMKLTVSAGPHSF